MIKSFRSERLERYWMRGDARGLPSEHIKRLNTRLSALDVAASPQEINVPGWRFHALTGDMQGRRSVRITGNWRLTFAWHDPDAIDVDFEDCH